MKNIPWKKIGITLLWVLGIATIGLSLAFTEIKQHDLKCKKITINVNKSDENYFINKQDISAIIQFGGDSLLNKYVNKINVKRLEKLIEANKYISNAEVFIDLNGELFVNVQQRKPLLRIFTADQHSFYLDEHGLKMPLSPNYSAKVLSANGNIEEIYGGIFDSVKNPLLNDLFELTKFIKANEFWDAQIEQIFIEENKDITLIPRVGNQKILFGSIENRDEKFEKLFLFYTKAMPKVGWDTYSIINLKFKNQIVATKSGMSIVLPKPILDTVVATDRLDTTLTVL